MGAAAALARDALSRGPASRLAGLRRTLRDRMRASPLADYLGPTRRLEAAYREMWRAWCASAGRELSSHADASSPPVGS